MHVAPDRERGRLADDLAVEDDVDHGQVLGIKAELDGPTDEEWLDPIAVGEQRHRGGLCHPAGDRPPEGLADNRADRGSFGGPSTRKRAMGVVLVSACTRVLATCSAQAMKESLSSSKLLMPAASASAKKRSRI